MKVNVTACIWKLKSTRAWTPTSSAAPVATIGAIESR